MYPIPTDIDVKDLILQLISFTFLPDLKFLYAKISTSGTDLQGEIDLYHSRA